MYDNKYGKVLTVFLIIAIIAIIALIGFAIFNKVKDDNMKKEADTTIEEFKRDHNITDDDNNNDNNNDDDNDIPDILPATPIPNPYENNNNNSNSSSSSSKKTTYKGFVMTGFISIPKNKVEVPILEKATLNSLNAATGILYPVDAKLNEPGNVVIAGHNYRNNLVFSKNKNLKEGDKIYITDESGRKLTYTVYRNFEASPEDTSFYERDTGGVPEITLTTCTQDSSKRTIIFAKAN